MLTKNDLNQIRTTVKEELNKVDGKLDGVEKRLTEVDGKLDGVEKRLTEKIDNVRTELTEKIENVQKKLETDIKNLREEIGEDFAVHFTTMQDFHMKLEGRVEKIENRLELTPESS